MVETYGHPVIVTFIEIKTSQFSVLFFIFENTQSVFQSAQFGLVLAAGRDLEDPDLFLQVLDLLPGVGKGSGPEIFRPKVVLDLGLLVKGLGLDLGHLFSNTGKLPTHPPL